MASPAQIDANRLNAQRSTGPRSDEGKSNSRFNALKHGLEARSLVIPGEDPAELEALALEYRQHLNPVGPLEAYLVDTIVQADWSRRRYARIEAQAFTVMIERERKSDPTCLLVYLSDEAARFAKLLAAAERRYYRALKELQRARKDRQAQEEDAREKAAAEPAPAPAPVPAPVPPPAAEPQIGFVPPIRTQPAPHPSAFTGVPLRS